MRLPIRSPQPARILLLQAIFGASLIAIVVSMAVVGSADSHRGHKHPKAHASATTRQLYARATIRAHCGDFSGGSCTWAIASDDIFLTDCHGGGYKCWNDTHTHAEKGWWELTTNYKGSHGHIRKSDNAVTYFCEVRSRDWPGSCGH